MQEFIYVKESLIFKIADKKLFVHNQRLTHFMTEIHYVLQGYVAVYVIRGIVVRAHSRAVEAATAIKLAANVTSEISLEFREEIVNFKAKLQNYPIWTLH